MIRALEDADDERAYNRAMRRKQKTIPARKLLNKLKKDEEKQKHLCFKIKLGTTKCYTPNSDQPNDQYFFLSLTNPD